jgi:hypothetical protein
LAAAALRLRDEMMPARPANGEVTCRVAMADQAAWDMNNAKGKNTKPENHSSVSADKMPTNLVVASLVSWRLGSASALRFLFHIKFCVLATVLCFGWSAVFGR